MATVKATTTMALTTKRELGWHGQISQAEESMTTLTVPKLTVTPATLPADEHGRIRALTRAPNGRIYAAVACEVLVSDDDGRTFARTASRPSSRTIYGIHAEDDRVYVVGAGGANAISVSDDGGLTWIRLPLDHQGNLYRMHRAPDGTLWACGDHEALFRSRDGVRFTAPVAPPRRASRSGRYLDVIFAGDAVLALSSAGEIVRVRDAIVESLALAVKEGSAGVPLTRRLDVAGVWLVVGDRGAAFRSEDGGQTFTRLALPETSDIEDGVVTRHGVFLVTGRGELLCSPDGRRFAVACELDDRLWSILALADGGLLVAGDGGVIARVDVSAAETAIVVPGGDATAAIHNAYAAAVAEGPPLEDEEDAADANAATEADAPDPRVGSLEEASARWRREGAAFIDALNAYVRRCYDVGAEQAGDEPADSRGDMADHVRRNLIELNAAGEHRRARALFPPAYEPFDYAQLGSSVDAVAFLDGERRLVATRGAVFIIEPDRISPVDGVRFFGRSPDGRHHAKVMDDRIDVHRGWDGPLIRTLPRPAGVLAQLVLTPEGEGAAVATAEGVFWLHASGAIRELLGPASYPHVALSPDGRFLAYGTQDTAHLLLDRKTGLRHAFEPFSSYPHFAFFHEHAPRMVLSSCHALYGSGSIHVKLDRLTRGQPEHVFAIDRRAWVCSGRSLGDRYLLGDRSGYVWAVRPGDGEGIWFVYLGSALTAMDVSADGKKLLVGSYAGYAIELDLDAPAPDRTLLTNGPVKETRRWVFWKGQPPLIW